MGHHIGFWVLGGNVNTMRQRGSTLVSGDREEEKGEEAEEPNIVIGVTRGWD